MPDISIVMPSRGRMDTVLDTLRSLGSQDLEGRTCEIVFVDNGYGPDDRRAIEEVLSDLPLPARYLRWERGGAAGARNAGVRASESPVILFLNDDLQPACSKLVVGHLRAHAERDDPWRGVLGRIVWPPDDEVTPVMEWLLRTGRSHRYAGLARENPACDLFYAANGSLTRHAIESVDGFDERFSGYGYAEYDLGLRLAERGFNVAYRPELVVWHRHRHDLADSLSRMEAVGRAALLMRQVHADRMGLRVPDPDSFVSRLTRRVGPPARWTPSGHRVPRPIRDAVFRLAHRTAVSRGLSSEPAPADPALRGGIRGGV